MNTYTLTATSRTSAAVLAKDGSRLRTLWSNKQQAAGTYPIPTWDGLDDTGSAVSTVADRIEVVENNVQAVWEGVLGNTSTNKSGPTVHHNTNGMPGMVIVGDTAYYTGDYNEHAPGRSEFKFKLATPGLKMMVVPSERRGTATTVKVCSDGTNVYWGGWDAWLGTPSFVFATKVSDDSQVSFASGQGYQTAIGDYVPSIINSVASAGVTSNPTDATYQGNDCHISGLAVQKTGSYLFVARKGKNTISVVNKTSGALVTTLPITVPLDLATDNANNLLVTTGTTITKYAVNADGTLGSTLLTIAGLQAPVGVQVSPDNTYVLVADGGSSQQLKAFNYSTGAALWTFGQAGGYANGPEVTADKFCFANTKQIVDVTAVERSFIAFQPDGSFWLEDQGTYRTLHYSADRALLTTMQNTGYNYSVYVDQNNPTRVFSNYLEYQVDYSKPLLPDNGSWKLVRNWVYGITGQMFDQAACLYGVATLSNGRTYAMNNIRPYHRGIVELQPTGNLRFTGDDFSNWEVLYPDGSLWKVTGTDLGKPAVWQRRALTGFDANNNPQWGAWATMATSPPVTPYDPVPAGGDLRFSHQTTSGNIIAFSREKYKDGSRSIGYHLGAIKAGTSQWLWRTAPSTAMTYSGPFPTDGSFDLGNDVHEAGAWMQTSGNLILWGYRGEFWKSTQVNKWHLYDDNGNFLVQFGTTGDVAKQLGEAPPEMAGNNISGTLVKVGSDYYLYHCDEGFHGGIHRWKISNTSSISSHQLSLASAPDPDPLPTAAPLLTLAPDLNYLLWAAPETAIADLSWKASIAGLYEFSPNGKGYLSYSAASEFGVKKLSPGKLYTLVATQAVTLPADQAAFVYNPTQGGQLATAAAWQSLTDLLSSLDASPAPAPTTPTTASISNFTVEAI